MRETHYLKLTRTDREILDSYQSTLDSFGTYLGEGFEIILHSLEDLHHSAIKVINGYHSGRSVGAPITDLALQFLSRLEEDPRQISQPYFNQSPSGAVIRSTTIPIYGENKRVIGLICINFYTDTPLFTLLQGSFPSNGQQNLPPNNLETFSNDMEDMVASAIESARAIVYQDAAISSSNKNKEIIHILHDKGIFNVKDSVMKTAKLLNISKNTVYMHIRNLS